MDKRPAVRDAAYEPARGTTMSDQWREQSRIERRDQDMISVLDRIAAALEAIVQEMRQQK